MNRSLFLALSLASVAAGLVIMTQSISWGSEAANAYLRDAGDDWECERGFARTNDACARVVVPPNGFLDNRGDTFRCERGFRRDAAACAAIVPPAHGQLDYSGNDWRCEDGFRVSNGACIADR